MRKEQLLLLAVLIPFAAIAFLIARGSSDNKISNLFQAPSPYPTISQNSDNTSEAISLAPAASKNIEVLSPRVGDTIRSGFRVMGNARVFENVVSIRLADSFGNILVQTTTMANAPDAGKFGPFEEVLNFQTNDEQGTLEVYQVSARDGSEIDKVSIPVLFK